MNRSTASRSDNPSSRCSTITAATTDGGTDRRPTSANRSTNSPSGNSTSRCPCRNAKIEFGGSASSQNRVTGSNRSNCCEAIPNATNETYRQSTHNDGRHASRQPPFNTSHLGPVSEVAFEVAQPDVDHA